MKIMLLGDSIAKGVAYDEESERYITLKDSFAALVEKNTDIELENAASFGSTVVKGEKILEKIGAAVGEYDYVLIEFGGNDCDYDWAKVADNPDAEHDCKTPPAIFEQKYKVIIERIKQLGGSPVALTLPPIHSERFFRWVSKGLNSDNILKFLGDVEHIGRWHKGFDEAVRKAADVCKIPLIDIRSDFYADEKESEYICADGIHPNSGGHKIIYNSIARQTKAFPALA